MRRSVLLRFVAALCAVVVVNGGILLLYSRQTAPMARASGAPYASYYVALGGSDGNDGLTPERPFATVAHARDVVRALPHGDWSGDVVVNLLDGVYTQAQTLTFTSQDSGANGYDVIYQASGYGTPQQAHPVLSGGRQITGWTLADPSRNIWRASAPGLETRQLYVNGVRAPRASGPAPATLVKSADGLGFTDSAATLASWSDGRDVEFVFRGAASGGRQWSESRCGAGAVAGATILMKQPCWANALAASAGEISRPTSIENAAELLDQPGEWYLNRATATLYYMSRPGEDMASASVIAPALETLVSGTGTLDQPLRRLVFRGLTFAYATWLRPNDDHGFAEEQANFTLVGQGASDSAATYGGNWVKTPANVTFHAAREIRFERDVFAHLGGAGLGFEYGSQDNILIGDTFTDLSGSAIQIGDVNDFRPTDQREINDGNEVLDCYIHAIGVEYHGAVGVWAGYTQNTLIAHNQLDDLPYTGVSTGWGWGETPTSPNIVRNTRILSNLIFDYMQALGDGGGVYSLGPQGTTFANGLLILGNVVRGQRAEGNAIYNDGGSLYVTDQSNVLYDAPNAWGGCREGVAYGQYRFQRNYTQTLIPNWGCGAPDAVTQANNIPIAGGAACDADPECHTITQSAGLEPGYRDLLRVA